MVQELQDEYLVLLDQLAQEIQEAPALQSYLEEEEEDFYNQLKDEFEPRIGEMYASVAEYHPLQLVALERVLIDPAFEGLFIPKILGYTVLRGEIDDQFHYTRPQDHFREILLAISESSNFEVIKKRVGQSIQIGFALSSDIWITNLINELPNKKVRYYLQSQKLEKYRVPAERKTGYLRFRQQFAKDNYYSADFPKNLSELKVLTGQLKQFLIERIRLAGDNSSLHGPLMEFVMRPEFAGHPEHLQILVLYAAFFDMDEGSRQQIAEVFNKVRKEMPGFEEHFWPFILQLHDSEKIEVTPAADQRLSVIVDRKIKDDLSDFYDLTDDIHGKGYIKQEVQQAVKVFHNQHEGLSNVNQALRQTIFGYFKSFIPNLEIEDYHELFEISKVYTIYIEIFGNQQFNQQIKDLSMRYVNRLMRKYSEDKRGKDYQDIKKFVSTTFQDLGFLKEKEIIEMFKTRRKKKTA